MRHMKNVIKRAFGLTVSVCILLLAFSGCTKTPDVGQSSSGKSSANGENSVSSTPASDSSEPDSSGSITNVTDFKYESINSQIYIKKYLGSAENVDIPKEIDGLPVTNIYIGAFRNNTSIVSVSIPDTVTNIESSAFAGCTSLKFVSLPPNLKVLGYGAFASCKALNSITIPKGIETWESGVFALCTSLTNVEFEKGATNIGASQTFYKCSSLTSFKFPEGATDIPDSYFEYCTSLKTVTLPNSLLSLGYGAFAHTALESVIIPHNVNYLNNPFGFCKSLNSIKFEGDAPDVEKSTFSTIGNANLIIYYHEDKEGWTSPTFRNVPTEIW